MEVSPSIRSRMLHEPLSAKLAFETATDPGWPSFMRIHPIINWSYHDVWTYLRRFQVPYCDLYDKGSVLFPSVPLVPLTDPIFRYTSLGSVHNTFPNPALRIGDSAGDETQPAWKPAYELQDGSLERAGRVSTVSTRR